MRQPLSAFTVLVLGLVLGGCHAKPTTPKTKPEPVRHLFPLGTPADDSVCVEYSHVDAPLDQWSCISVAHLRRFLAHVIKADP